MIMESLNEYLETVAGYIFDNDKLVTYKWLSKELEIHVNTAKQILWEFWQKHKEEKNFECTFLLIGALQDEGMRVEVVKEKDLSAAKEKYSKVLSQHIYSLQKVLPEIQLLGLVENGDIRYGAIKCIENNERSNKEIHMLRWGTMANEVESASQEKVQPIAEQTNAKKVMSSDEKQMDKKKSAEKKGFNALFGKTTTKQINLSASTSTEKVEVNASETTKQTLNAAPGPSKKPVKKGVLNSFFQQDKSQAIDNKSIQVPEKNNTSPIEKKRAQKKVASENVTQQKYISGKKRSRSKDSSGIVKRRKRIEILSDSSDTGSSDEEQEIPPSPIKVSPVRIHSPSPPQVKFESGKRKLLKMVDKTFEEDGFLVTKKVHVYESCSEEEPESIHVKKPVASEPQPEVKGKKNTKQTTLMNFFKKS